MNGCADHWQARARASAFGEFFNGDHLLAAGRSSQHGPTLRHRPQPLQALCAARSGRVSSNPPCHMRNGIRTPPSPSHPRPAHLADCRTLTDASNGSRRTHTTKSWLCRLPIGLRDDQNGQGVAVRCSADRSAIGTMDSRQIGPAMANSGTWPLLQYAEVASSSVGLAVSRALLKNIPVGWATRCGGAGS